jgi:site-specific recombinase XerD
MLPDYLDHLRANGCSPKTVSQYHHKIRQFTAWLAGRKPTNELLNVYCREMQERGLRPRTIRVAFTALKSFRDYMVARGRTGLPDFQGLKLPRLDPPQRETPTEADLAAIWKGAREMPEHSARAKWLRSRTLAVLALFNYAGLRRSELLSLNLDDIQQGEQWQVRIRRGKGGQTRRVPLNAEARELLTEWIAVRNEWATDYQCPLDCLFPVDRTRRMSHRGLRALWTDLMGRAGLQKRGLTPHGMRHAFASSVERTSGLKMASTLLGHSNITTTAAYLHADPSRMVAAVELIVPERQVPKPEPIPLERPAPRRSVSRGLVKPGARFARTERRAR